MEIRSARAAIHRKSRLLTHRHAVAPELDDRASTILVEGQAASWWSAANSLRKFRFVAIAGDLARKLPVVVSTGCNLGVTEGCERRCFPLVV
ncbi:hypothetical protein [Symmachiella dynata]|uniref:hypothetical protein n=1 Tax=Symmachiella dynata TaxID=2527995 RepID=UPI0011A98835|nr:hypothetical protein [Symmachiella dynata]